MADQVELWRCVGCGDWSFGDPPADHRRFVFLDDLVAGDVRARTSSGRLVPTETKYRLPTKEDRRSGFAAGAWIECGPVEAWVARAVRSDG